MAKYQVEYTDENGATTPIDTITTNVNYTADDYIKDCEKNADPEYIEMLHNGKIELVEIDD